MTRENTMFLVKNRSAGIVFYKIPNLGIARSFQPGETMKISFNELEKLSWEPGGKTLMANFLQIQADQAIQDLQMKVQPEYYMTEAQIKDLLLTGSLEAFLDCLDFAPIGVIDLVKKYAVALPLSDYAKREAMKEKLGFDVDKVLAMKKAEAEEAKNPSGFVADKTTSTAAPATTRPTARRTSTTYKDTSTTTK